MKIIKIESINSHLDGQEHYMDLINVIVEHMNGITGKVSMCRAHYNNIVYQQYMMEKYNIPQKEFDILNDLFSDDFASEHFYDESD